MENRSTYSFSPTHPVNECTCSSVLTGILCSLVKTSITSAIQFCLADNRKNSLRNLLYVPSKPLCPPRLLWWHKLQTFYKMYSGRHSCHTSPIQFLLLPWWKLTLLPSSWISLGQTWNTLPTPLLLYLLYLSSPVHILVLPNWLLCSKLFPWPALQQSWSYFTVCDCISFKLDHRFV